MYKYATNDGSFTYNNLCPGSSHRSCKWNILAPELFLCFKNISLDLPTNFHPGIPLTKFDLPDVGLITSHSLCSLFLRMP